jgi:hypothetical protein
MALVDRPEVMNAEQASPAPLLEGDALEPGIVNEAEGSLPNEGGVESMADDVSTTAEQGDFILPYESLLFYGFKEINEMVLQAIDQLGPEVDLENVDEGAEVPIQISNFEYRIPRRLVPIIGEEKLEAIRVKGLEFRDQLEAVRSEGFVERDTPAMEDDMLPMPDEQNMAMAEEPMPMPQEAPAMPMMKGGGYVPMQGVGNVDNPGFNNPLQPPTRAMEKQTLDMRSGGLVKKIL